MPFFRWACVKCETEAKRLMPKAKAEKMVIDCPVCVKPMVLTIGLPQTRAMETADDYRGKKVVQDVGEKLDARAKEHFNQHDLPRLIAENGIEWAKGKGFVDADGRPK